MKLQLQSFGSMFELFATFTLAYILIDELTRRNFVSLVTERVLRSYQSIDSIFDEVNGKIAIQKTNLQSLTQQGRGDHSSAVRAHKAKLNQIARDSNKDGSDIQASIRSNYNNSNLFAYLNCYLFLYCLGILFIAGVYGSDSDKQVVFRLDKPLLVIFCFSLIYLLLGWFFDKRRVGAPGFMSQVYGLCNGYFVSVCYFLLLIGIAWIINYFSPPLFFTWTWPMHNALVVFCILLPVSNFIVYIIKAYRRVQVSRPVLIERAKLSKSRSMQKLEEIEEFVSHCKYSNRLQLASHASSMN